jgi:monoamine oxidase
MLHYVKHYVHTTIEQEFASDVDDMCSREWYTFADLGAGHRVFTDGFDKLPDKLACKLDVRLDHAVERIEHDRAGVRVVTQRGAFVADRAIITLPLGILKSGQVEFSPPLPANKIDAMRRLGMGVLNKLILRFPVCFWPRESEWLEYAGERTGEWALFFNLFKHIVKPVLVAFNSGTFARELEELPDHQIVEQCLAVLRTMFGPNIPSPDGWLVTRWASDPFSLGSYSFIPSGGSGADMDALAEPVGDRLYFAGEATSRAQYATVQGAFFSGFRAAGEIAVPESAQLVASLNSATYHRSRECLDARHIALANRIQGLFAKQGRNLHSGCP